MYQHQHAPLPLEQLKAVPQPILVLFEKLLEKDPAQRFQTPDELLKTIPTITGAIEARRRITRQSPQKAPFSTLRVRTRKPPTRPAPKKRDKERLAHRDQSREILVSSAPNSVSNFPMTLFAALVVIIGLIWFASHGGRKTALPTPTPILESTPKPTPQSRPTPAPESTPRLTPKSSPARTTESAPTPMPIPAWIAPSWTPESKPRLTPTPTSSDPAFYTNRGFEAFKESDYDGAIRDFTEAIRLDPNNATAYDKRGWSYSLQRDYDKAISDFTEAIRLDPNIPAFYDSRADAYVEMENYQKAISDYAKAIRLDPKDVEAYHGRGVCYRHQGKKTQAQADFDKAKQLGYTGSQ